MLELRPFLTMNSKIRPLVHALLGKSLYDYLLYSRFCLRSLRRLGLPNRKAEGEEAYRDRWRQFYPLVDPHIYRLFSNFCGPTPDIIPEDILHRVIEECLNPRSYWDVYEDKTMFPFVLGREYLPTTVLARVQGGHLLGADLQPVSHPEEILSVCPYDALILKPSVGTSCGHMVMRFDRVGRSYRSSSGQVLSEQFLIDYNDNLVLQQCVQQHPFTAHLCPTAVNSMRIVVYRSVIDDQPHVTSAYFRVGGPGAVVDNCHSGGGYVAINIANGILADTMFDEYGHHSPFPDAGQTLPSWDKAVELAYHVARCIPHHHLFALDMAIDANGKPVLLEYNIGGFSSHAGYFCGQTVFGQYTDEVISWVLARARR